MKHISVEESGNPACGRQCRSGCMRLAGSQRGASVIAILFMISVAVFLGLFAIKVGPAYFENMTVSKIARDTAANAELMHKPKSVVYESIAKAYRMNNLWDLKPDETIELVKDGRRGYVVSVNYEKRSKFFANIDVVTVFDKQVEPGS